MVLRVLDPMPEINKPPQGKPMEHILRLLEAIRAAVANR